MFCPKCGKEICDADVFCKSCGEQLKKEKDCTLLLDLKPRKTGWQAVLIYFIFVIGQILLLSFVAYIMMTVMKAQGTPVEPVTFKADTKKWGLLFNPLTAMVLSLVIMKIKNLFNSKKAYAMLVFAIIVSYLFSAVIGFIFPAVLTRFSPVEE